jgi:two-component system sensor histidine kinase KdpD
MATDLSSFRQDSDSNTKPASLAGNVWQSEPWASLLSVAGIGLMSCLISLSHVSTRLVNVSLLYLLVVVLCGAYLGRVPALISSICGFIAFNLCLVQPTQLDASSECIALAVFLITALVIGQLTALLKARAEEAELRRSEMEILAEASWAVASEPQQTIALNKVMKLISNIEPVDSVVLRLIDGSQNGGEKVVHSIGNATQQNGPRLLQTFPVMLEDNRLGSIALTLKAERTLQYEENRLVESLINHIAALLERERLLKAESKAIALIEADALKTALLAMVSHDFRSPLTTIKASVSALLEDGNPWDPAMQKNLLEAADQETDRLNKLVGNILALSKLEGGAWKPRREAIPVQEMSSSVLSTFSDEENERIRLSLPENPSDLFVDPVQMEQVLHNLIENALKYSQPDQFVEMEVKNLGTQTQFEISDRGIGLPQGDEAQIFEKFYRAESLVESNIPGLGIGLAVCKGLVEANGGSLTAQQRDGGGAVFRMVVANVQGDSNE